MINKNTNETKNSLRKKITTAAIAGGLGLAAFKGVGLAENLGSPDKVHAEAQADEVKYLQELMQKGKEAVAPVKILLKPGVNLRSAPIKYDGGDTSQSSDHVTKITEQLEISNPLRLVIKNDIGQDETWYGFISPEAELDEASKPEQSTVWVNASKLGQQQDNHEGEPFMRIDQKPLSFSPEHSEPELEFDQNGYYLRTSGPKGGISLVRVAQPPAGNA